MKKKCGAIYTLTLLIIVCLLFGIFVFGDSIKNIEYQHPGVLADELFKGSIKQVGWDELSCEERESLLERLITAIYAPQIKNEVDKYYKEPRGFDVVGIADVGVVAPYEYEMKIQISTYVGAHNPPYGADMVTIRFKRLSNGTVVNYEHKEDNSSITLH
jgi:hypothetical protein